MHRVRGILWIKKRPAEAAAFLYELYHLTSLGQNTQKENAFIFRYFAIC